MAVIGLLAFLFFLVMAIIPTLRHKISPNFSLKKSLLFGLIGFIIMIIGSVNNLSSDDKPPTTIASGGDTTIAQSEPKPIKEPAKPEDVVGIPVEKEVVKEASPAPEPAVKETAGQSNAVRSAKNYLSFTSFSREGLIAQLEFEGYSKADAEYAVDHSGADWREHAVKAARNYLSFTAFSKKGLIEQLEFEGYSKADAEYAVDQSGADWKEQAVKAAHNYLDFSSFSKQGLKEQLEFEGYTSEQAQYGVDEAYQ